jgi:ABC-type multidrug transport system fused ATPase/permease subunit
VAYATVSVLEGVLPGAMAWAARMIVNTVGRASATGALADRLTALHWVSIEGVLALLAGIAARGTTLCETLLRDRLGDRISLLLLEKAAALPVEDLENPTLQAELGQARREAEHRPLQLVEKVLSAGEKAITLLIFAGLLYRLSPWMLLLLLGAGVPSFVAETRFSLWSFYAERWKSVLYRFQSYLARVLVSDHHAKEVRIFDLGPYLLSRYRTSLAETHRQDMELMQHRGRAGIVLGSLSSVVLYGANAWIVWQTMQGRLTIGDMTMYLLLFRHGQSAVYQGFYIATRSYDDLLAVSNIYRFLDYPTRQPSGTATSGPNPGDGIRFDAVSFKYPRSQKLAVQDVTFHLPPGRKLALVGENGSGKTTLTKLLARLYQPDSGRIRLDGRDLQEWDVGALHRRFAVIFQDFVRYEFIAGENIGIGLAPSIDNETLWRAAAAKGLADGFISELPQGYQTPLGQLLEGAQELSTGQWQKVALSRAFMRTSADIVVLDEPTAAIVAQAEARIFERLRALTAGQMAVLISHRFSTVRLADEILVLNQGRITERGSHAELMALGGQYAQSFTLQAEPYQ